MAQGNHGRLYRLGRELEKMEKLEKQRGPGFGLGLFFSKPLNARRDDERSLSGLLKPQRNLVISVGVIFKHCIETTLLNVGSGQIWAGSQQR